MYISHTCNSSIRSLKSIYHMNGKPRQSKVRFSHLTVTIDFFLFWHAKVLSTSLPTPLAVTLNQTVSLIDFFWGRQRRQFLHVSFLRVFFCPSCRIRNVVSATLQLAKNFHCASVKFLIWFSFAPHCSLGMICFATAFRVVSRNFYSLWGVGVVVVVVVGALVCLFDDIHLRGLENLVLKCRLAPFN